MRKLTRFATIAALTLPLSAFALLIRADRDDAEYVEMATKYASAVSIDVPGGAEGVLINARWVLTSARVGLALKQMKTMPLVKAGTREIKIQAVFVHPVWRPDSNSADMALVYLARAANVEPTPIYRGDDEAGKSVVIVGRGDTGKIGDKATRQDHKVRAGINTIDRLSPKIFAMTIKAGDDAADLQAAFASGEAGGPAFYQTESKELFVVGVASSSKDENSNGAVDTGDQQVYVRVSAYAEWIDATIDKVNKEELNNLFSPSGG
ncbi:MAG TPA: S1 family peptidase [Usitatibacter sp.]